MSRAEAWLAEAEADLEAAQVLLTGMKYNACAFYAQQAAEKAVKALLFFLHEAPWGHSVSELLDRVAARGLAVPLPLVDDARQLDLHYIPSRYPDALPSGTPSGHYTRTMGEDALSCARKLVEFAKTQLQG
ncbi:MAG: HEPN domain-containing protein [Bacillota bacterium]|nr:HEPN domain-containing protein [Bacillota bacterium]